MRHGRWLHQKMHSRWQVAGFSAGVLLGVVLAPYAPLMGWLELLISGFLLLAALRLGKRWCIGLAVLAGMLLGLWRAAPSLRAQHEYAAYRGQEVTLSGRVNEDVTVSSKGAMRVRMSAVRIGPRHMGSEVWISTTTSDIKRGDTITVRGKLAEGFGAFAASMYRATLVKIERPYPGDVARRARDWFAAAVRKGVREPEASLGIGFLTGQHSALPVHLEEQLRATGLTHAVVASGYNLTILVSFMRTALLRLSKYLAVFSASILIVCFMFVTGFGPSMSRAGLVAGLSLLAWYYGRAFHPFVLLPMSAAVTALIKPSYLWGDLGWYLSFTAFAGVMILAPLVRHYFWGAVRQPGVLMQTMTDTLSAQLATMPIILLAFGTLAPYALLANILVLPFVPAAMALTFGAGLVCSLMPQWASIGGWPASALLHYMTEVINWVASLPGAQRSLAFDGSAVAISYLLLAGLCGVLWRKTGYRWQNDNPEKLA